VSGIQYTPPSQASAIAVLAAAVTSLHNDVIALQSDVSDLTKAACGRAFYAPNATPSRNVFATFEEAAAALAPFGGGDLVIDTRGGAASTAGVFVDVTGIRFVGLNYNTDVLTVVEGTAFGSDYNQFSVSNVAIEWAGESSPFALSGGASLGVTLEDYASIRSTAAATGPFFDVGSGCTLYADVGYQCALGKDPAGNALVDMAAAPGTSCTINMLVGSTLDQDTLTGGGDGAYLIVDRTAGLTTGGGNATISHTQTGTTNPQFVPGLLP